MRQGPVDKSVGDSTTGKCLLPNTGNHLTDVDVGPLGPTDGHNERGIVLVQFLHANVTRLPTDTAENSIQDGLQNQRPPPQTPNATKFPDR